MISSVLVSTVLATALAEYDGPYYQQIPYLSIKETDYTGMGVYIYFSISEEVYKYPSLIGEHERMFFDDSRKIINTELNIEASTIVWIKNGWIDCLEIWNINGVDYPVEEYSEFKFE